MDLLAAQTVPHLDPPTAINAPFTSFGLMAIVALAGAGTWLLLPRRGESKTFPRIGLGMSVIAFVATFLCLIQWAAIATNVTAVYYWLFSAIAIGSAIRVITHKQPVYSSLYFVLTVLASAGLFVLMWAEFMAAALVIIYAGAILVTYTFVIMLASEASGEGIVSKLTRGTMSKGEPKTEGTMPTFEHDTDARSPFLAVLGGFVTMGAMLLVIFNKATTISKHGPIVPDASVKLNGNVQKLGAYLFTHQAVSLQLAGLILTLAMVGAMMLARKHVLLSSDDEFEAGQADAPFNPGDDNPHSIPVDGETGPRTRHRDRELAEI